MENGVLRERRSPQINYLKAGDCFGKILKPILNMDNKISAYETNIYLKNLTA